MSDGYLALRDEFVRLLTVDSPHDNTRRRDFNEAVFMPMDGQTWSGHAIWTQTTLDMVLDKFDKAVKNLARE